MNADIESIKKFQKEQYLKAETLELKQETQRQAIHEMEVRIPDKMHIQKK